MPRTLFALLISLVVVFPAASILAGDDAEDEEGYISLFNGKDFTGWTIGDKDADSWRVEDGALVAQGPRSHLFTEQEFKNFIFKAEVMTKPGSNGGIYIHTKHQDTGWPDHGYETQVNVTQRDPVKTGSLYNVIRLYETPAQDNEWWTQTIIVRGKRIIVKINDELVIDYEEPPGVTGTRKLSQGSFALQAHDPGSTVYFRNIRVKPLDD